MEEELYEDEENEPDEDELDDELPLPLDELEDDELDDEELDDRDRLGAVFGAVFSHSRMSSVSAPREMDVKKLMLNLVLRGSSLGMTP